MSDANQKEKAGAPNRNLAVALHYSGRGAPRVVAKGGGLIADNIITTARAHGVPLDEDATLAGALSRVDLGQEIPRELYIAVAQVLAFAWGVNKKIDDK
ncbi:MAG: EscU/YscU/HrcU family type III secretion system export apparatus switch protein [Steroidobacteraceae bacterium]